jgi:DNA polymerase III psi subunit
VLNLLLIQANDTDGNANQVANTIKRLKSETSVKQEPGIKLEKVCRHFVAREAVWQHEPLISCVLTSIQLIKHHKMLHLGQPKTTIYLFHYVLQYDIINL